MSCMSRTVFLLPFLWTLGVPLHAQSQEQGELPLDASGVLEFTTDEGTWISLDVTPDGQTILFELMGDLYRVALEGGEATRVTEGMGFDSQPRISPDGEWVAFVSDRDGNDNLWVARIDGSDARKLSSERRGAVFSPSWTPDGRYLVVSQRGERGGIELRMYHREGGSGFPLEGGDGEEGGGSTSTRTPTRMGPVVSPDGRYLFFSQAPTGSSQPFPRWQIGRMEMATGAVDLLTQAEFGAVRPALSPDGRLLVYATRHETETGLRLRNLETGEDRWLVWPVQPDEIESGGSPSRDLFPGYAFTPDGREVVVTFDGGIHRVDVETGEASPIPFEARVSVPVGPDLEAPYRLDDGPVRATLLQDPQLSPNGQHLVFSLLTHIYTLELGPEGEPEGTPQRLTSSQDWEFKPTWSPDGRWIAYVTWDGSDGHVWRVPADGSGTPERLTSVSAFYTDLVYAPDGDRIVGLRGNAYLRQQTFSEFGGLRIPLDLVWLPATGGDVELVAPARGLGAPHFTGDRERIFVYSSEGLISLRFDGTDRKTHLEVRGPGRFGVTRPPAASSVVMHPDGGTALAAVNNQIWVVAVPPFTGSAATVNVRSPSLPAYRLTDIGADYFGWADEGGTITWAVGSTFYRRSLESVELGAEGAEGEDDGDEENGVEGPRDLHEAVDALEIVMEFPRAIPRGTVVLRGGTAITMNGDEVIPSADVVITDNRITYVGPIEEVDTPEDARIFDVSGTYIVPGFIDTHAHWEFRTHDVLEPHNWSLIANLAYGVTAGLDVQTSTNDYFAYRDLVETGQALGQRAFMTGPGVFSNQDFRSYDEVLAYLQRYRDHYRTVNIKSYMVGNREQRQWVVMAAEELGLMPTTEGGRDLRLNMTHALDGMHGNEHTLPVFPLFRDVTELFARTRTAYTPTLLVQYGGPSAREWFFTRTEVLDDPKVNRFNPRNRLSEMARRRSLWVRDDEFRIEEAAAQAAKIKRAGGLVGVGGHGELQGLGYHWEMWALAMGGMEAREVLEAATIDGARIIGFADDLGSLEEGKLADLVVLESNPLEDIRNTTDIRWVMKNGELFDGESMDQLWPEERELTPFWWWGEGPDDRRGGP